MKVPIIAIAYTEGFTQIKCLGGLHNETGMLCPGSGVVTGGLGNHPVEQHLSFYPVPHIQLAVPIEMIYLLGPGHMNIEVDSATFSDYREPTRQTGRSEGDT